MNNIISVKYILNQISNITNDYNYHKYEHAINKIDEVQLLLSKNLYSKLSLSNDFSEEEQEILKNIPVIWASTKKITKFMYDEFFWNINYLKIMSKKDVYYQILSLKDELVENYKLGIDLTDENKSEIIEYSKKILILKKFKVKNELDNNIVKLLNNEYKKIYSNYQLDFNILENLKLSEDLYYFFELLKTQIESEFDDWKEIKCWKNLSSFKEQESNDNKGYNKKNIRNDNNLAYYLNLMYLISTESESKYWDNLTKENIIMIYNAFITPEKEQKYNNKLISKIGEGETNNLENDEKVVFIQSRLKDILFSLKMIYFQEYIYNYNYNLDEYYINFINNVFRLVKCLNN